jgi:hypothetical protein
LNAGRKSDLEYEPDLFPIYPERTELKIEREIVFYHVAYTKKDTQALGYNRGKGRAESTPF